jgi:hypothetical protein
MDKGGCSTSPKAATRTEYETNVVTQEITSTAQPTYTYAQPTSEIVTETQSTGVVVTGTRPGKTSG